MNNLPTDLEFGRSESPRRMRRGVVMARVAVADDDPESLDLLSLALRSPTTEIHRAANGAALARLIAQQGPFDLIVTDVDMPWLQGPHAIKMARALEIDNAPVLFVTGLASADIDAAIAGLGNARLLRKPIEIAALRQAVAELLGSAP